MKIFRSFLCLLLIHLTTVSAIDSILSPSNASVFINDNVEFHCKLSNDEGYPLIWIVDYDLNDEVVSGILSNVAQTARIMHFEDGHGNQSVDYSNEYNGSTTIHHLILRIDGVLQPDEGNYACGYTFNSRSFYLGTWGNLTILIPPTESNPSCTLLPNVISLPTPNSTISVSFVCVMSGGKPLPNLIWRRENSTISAAISTSNSLQYTISANDNGIPFTCVASGPALRQDGSCSTTPLLVNPSASILSSADPAVENTDVIFTCVGYGLPYISKIDWLYNGQLVSDNNLPSGFQIIDMSDGSSELHLFSIQLDNNNDLVACYVETPSGLSNQQSVTVSIIKYEAATGLTTSVIIPIASAAGGVILLLVIAILVTVIWKRRKSNAGRNPENSGAAQIVLEGRDNTYQMGAVSADNGLRATPSQQPAENYVINQIAEMNAPGDEPRSVTMGSDHPYDPVNFSSRQSDTRTRTPTNVAHLANRQAASPYASNIDGDSERLSYAELDLPHGPPIPRRQGYSTDYAVIEGEL
ncbi:uncharacterized protein [Amphiura filiformis]|uniref:uncharacterized protein isoform X2 n=1 Tax=Amphiura filiformis TaxID=82378 RepID=UPI003B2115B7